MSTDDRDIKRRRKIAENFNPLSTVHERTNDSQTTDGRATAYSEREPEFTFAKIIAKARDHNYLDVGCVFIG